MTRERCKYQGLHADLAAGNSGGKNPDPGTIEPVTGKILTQVQSSGNVSVKKF